MDKIYLMAIGFTTFMGSTWIFEKDPEPVQAAIEFVEPEIRMISNCSEIFNKSIYVPVPVSNPIVQFVPYPTKPATIEKRVAEKVCRRGEKIWYYNKSKKRNMYRIRKDC